MADELKPCHCGKPVEQDRGTAIHFTGGGTVGPFCEFHNILSAYEAGFVTVEDMAQRIVNLNALLEETDAS
jgi:hypothetical protein